MSDKEDTLALMRTRLKMAIGAFSDSREDELDDLRFFAGSPDNQFQWPADVLQTRGSVQGQTINARPCLTINKLPQHVRQITNDQRQNRPSGKVIPVDDKADPEVAEIFDGIVRHIEYISDADVAYDTACENQVSFGEGYFRILTEYCDENSFEQDIRIGRIRNSFSVYMDPTMQDPCGADAEWCFISEELLKEDYERQFPNARPISSLQSNGVGDESFSAWLDENTVRIAEYFYIEHKNETLNLYQEGLTATAGSPEAKMLEANGYKAIKTRQVDSRKVKWIKTNGYEILEERDWAGKWIPVIRVVGNEFEIDGRIHISGIVRNAKDAQRMYNYWVSQEAEMLALAPKAPFIGYGGQFEGYENQWKTANTTNWPYLEVNSDVTDAQGGPLPLPQRAAPPLPQAGLIQAKMGASDDIKTVTGQYDASLGADANEKSGKAIMARERQTDTGTYHYVDNLARAVRYGTRQIVDLIPKIYDTQRIARIIGLDGETSHAEINPNQKVPVQEIKDQETGAVIKKIYNPGIGKYDVCVTTGPSYMTKRQETAEMMVNLAQGTNDPTLGLVMRYFAIKNADFPEAQDFAQIIKKMLPPGLMEDGDESPELVAAKQQIEQMGQQMQEMGQIIESVQSSFEAQKMANEEFKADIQAYKAETERIDKTKDYMTPEEVRAITLRTMEEVMGSPSLEAEEPQMLEMGEQLSQQPPEPGVMQ